MNTLILHIENDDPIIGEVEIPPKPNDTLVMLRNPRRRDGKDISYMEANVTAAYWPLHRISFIEVLPSLEEEEIITFVRE